MSSLSISTIQANLTWENKAANLEMFAEKIAAIEEPTELVILPEMFSTGFSMNPAVLAEPMNGDTVEWMKETAIQNKIILPAPSLLKKKESIITG